MSKIQFPRLDEDESFCLKVAKQLIVPRGVKYSELFALFFDGIIAIRNFCVLQSKI